MMTATRLKHVSLALLTLGMASLWQGARAEGTLANTTISNQASVSYSVNGVSQTPINSAQVDFTVDRRIRFDVAEVSSGATNVTPGQTNAVAGFSIKNWTNAAQDFSLAIADEAATTLFSRTDNINAPNLRAFVDLGVVGTYEPAIDTQTFVPALIADGLVNIIVVADFPLTATNGQVANVRLTVRATTAGSSGATPEVESATNSQSGAPDVVIADTGRNNSEFASDQYFVQSAALAVTKTMSVINDPFNGTTSPKSIPGATIQYTIAVNNTGAQTATGVAVNDPIPANTTYVAGSITVNGAAVTDAGRTVGSPVVTAINVNPGAINAAATATVTFRVIIIP
jgi:uncharacterized repeat protein (TIGR01451 family)